VVGEGGDSWRPPIVAHTSFRNLPTFPGPGNTARSSQYLPTSAWLERSTRWNEKMAVLWRGRHGTFPFTSLCACADYASALGQGIDALPHLAAPKHLWPPAPLATPPHTTCALRCDGRIVLAAPFVLDLQSSWSTARSGMDERRPCRTWAGRRLGHCVLRAGMGWAWEFLPLLATGRRCSRLGFLQYLLSPCVRYAFSVRNYTIKLVRRRWLVRSPSLHSRGTRTDTSLIELLLAWSHSKDGARFTH
jgi:hypothetical protein